MFSRNLKSGIVPKSAVTSVEKQKELPTLPKPPRPPSGAAPSTVVPQSPPPMLPTSSFSSFSPPRPHSPSTAANNKQESVPTSSRSPDGAPTAGEEVHHHTSGSISIGGTPVTKLAVEEELFAARHAINAMAAEVVPQLCPILPHEQPLYDTVVGNPNVAGAAPEGGGTHPSSSRFAPKSSRPGTAAQSGGGSGGPQHQLGAHRPVTAPRGHSANAAWRARPTVGTVTAAHLPSSNTMSKRSGSPRKAPLSANMSQEDELNEGLSSATACRPTKTSKELPSVSSLGDMREMAKPFNLRYQSVLHSHSTEAVDPSSSSPQGTSGSTNDSKVHSGGNVSKQSPLRTRPPKSHAQSIFDEQKVEHEIAQWQRVAREETNHSFASMFVWLCHQLEELTLCEDRRVEAERTKTRRSAEAKDPSYTGSDVTPEAIPSVFFSRTVMEVITLFLSKVLPDTAANESIKQALRRICFVDEDRLVGKSASPLPSGSQKGVARTEERKLSAKFGERNDEPQLRPPPLQQQQTGTFHNPEDSLEEDSVAEQQRSRGSPREATETIAKDDLDSVLSSQSLPKNNKIEEKSDAAQSFEKGEGETGTSFNALNDPSQPRESFAAKKGPRDSFSSVPDATTEASHNAPSPPTSSSCAPPAVGGGVVRPWSLLVLQLYHDNTRMSRELNGTATALRSLRRTLPKLFRHEDRLRKRFIFAAWRTFSRDSAQQRRVSVQRFIQKKQHGIVGQMFRSWARVTSHTCRRKLLREAEEAAIAYKELEHRSREAIWAGREEISRELERTQGLLTEERAQRDRQFMSFSSEIESLVDDMVKVRNLLQLTLYHKQLWRSLWLTHHREKRLPFVAPMLVIDEAQKLREALKAMVACTKSSAAASNAASSAAPGTTSGSGRGSLLASVDTDPLQPVPLAGDGSGDAEFLNFGSALEFLTDSAADTAERITAAIPEPIAVASGRLLNARVTVRARLESLLTTWVNEMLVALNVQRFLVTPKEDLLDGVIYAALCHMLDHMSTRGPDAGLVGVYDGPPFSEEIAKKKHSSVLGKTLLATLMRATKRASLLPFAVPLLNLCPYTADRLTEPFVLGTSLPPGITVELTTASNNNSNHHSLSPAHHHNNNMNSLASTSFSPQGSLAPALSLMSTTSAGGGPSSRHLPSHSMFSYSGGGGGGGSTSAAAGGGHHPATASNQGDGASVVDQLFSPGTDHNATWHLWVLSTLFLDYALQQVYPLEPPHGVDEPTSKFTSRKAQRAAAGRHASTASTLLTHDSQSVAGDGPPSVMDAPLGLYPTSSANTFSGRVATPTPRAPHATANVDDELDQDCTSIFTVATKGSLLALPELHEDPFPMLQLHRNAHFAGRVFVPFVGGVALRGSMNGGAAGGGGGLRGSVNGGGGSHNLSLSAARGLSLGRNGTLGSGRNRSLVSHTPRAAEATSPRPPLALVVPPTTTGGRSQASGASFRPVQAFPEATMVPSGSSGAGKRSTTGKGGKSSKDDGGLSGTLLVVPKVARRTSEETVYLGGTRHKADSGSGDPLDEVALGLKAREAASYQGLYVPVSQAVERWGTLRGYSESTGITDVVEELLHPKQVNLEVAYSSAKTSDNYSYASSSNNMPAALDRTSAYPSNVFSPDDAVLLQAAVPSTVGSTTNGTALTGGIPLSHLPSHMTLTSQVDPAAAAAALDDDEAPKRYPKMSELVSNPVIIPEVDPDVVETDVPYGWTGPTTAGAAAVAGTGEGATQRDRALVETLLTQQQQQQQHSAPEPLLPDGNDAPLSAPTTSQRKSAGGLRAPSATKQRSATTSQKPQPLPPLSTRPLASPPPAGRLDGWDDGELQQQQISPLPGPAAAGSLPLGVNLLPAVLTTTTPVPPPLPNNNNNNSNNHNGRSPSNSSSSQQETTNFVQEKKKVHRYDAVLCEELFVEGQRRKAMWVDVCRLVMGAIVTFGALDAKNTTQRLHQARAAMSEGVGTPNVTQGARY